MLSVRRVVNYISALQNEPRNSDTSDVEDEEVHDGINIIHFQNLDYIHINDQTQTNKEILKNCRFATPSTPHHLNPN
ncbi:hypothetical protein T03_2696 [Trichinella britovi]|uniref:Uncharacterized protein n=1 Tax=Trichinella britovi TaxID=45882 RepID=A0A0V1DEV8_TRIBR|nr:hypothetical protein T03_2696 [Trichinella britovi]